MPIEERIVRDTGDDGNVDANTVVRLAPKIYPNGSVSLENSFQQSGKFVGIVTVGDRGQFVSRFPFAVGAGGGRTWLHIVVVIAVLGAGLLLLLWPRRTSKQPLQQP